MAMLQRLCYNSNITTAMSKAISQWQCQYQCHNGNAVTEMALSVAKAPMAMLTEISIC
jgi:hypothetical protein